MALSFTDREIDGLARELAALTGETLTDAVRHALQERLQRERLRRGQPAGLAQQLAELARDCAALPDYDRRTPKDIVGHNAHGTWT
jgi:antitoxin VapB